MKKLIYLVEGYSHVYNEETEQEEKRLSLTSVTVENPTEADIAKAAEVAHNGDYIIEDDGEPEPDTSTTDDVLNVLLGVTE